MNPKEAPAAIGPYSHAVKCGQTYYISGQVPFDPKTGEVVGVNMVTQAAQALKNLSAVLDAAGLNIGHIAKTAVFISDMDMFDELNQVYADFMGVHKPARACVQVARLPKDVLIEIEAIAVFE